MADCGNRRRFSAYYMQLAQAYSISAPAATNDMNQDGKWCYCRDEEHGQMIACDNEKCTIGWYHIDCLKLSFVRIVESSN